MLSDNSPNEDAASRRPVALINNCSLKEKPTLEYPALVIRFKRESFVVIFVGVALSKSLGPSGKIKFCELAPTDPVFKEL